MSEESTMPELPDEPAQTVVPDDTAVTGAGPAAAAKVKAHRVSRTVTAVCVLALMGAVTAFGARLEVQVPELSGTGTTVSVDAGAIALVCPTPVGVAKLVTAPEPSDHVSDEPTVDSTDEPAKDATDAPASDPTTVPPGAPEGDSSGEPADDTTDEPADEFAADQGGTKNLVQTTLVGAGGRVEFTDLGQPVDTQNPNAAVAVSDFDLPQSLAGKDPSAQLSFEGLNAGLLVSSAGRAISDASLGQLTAAAQASVTGAGDVRGIAAATCGVAQTEHWLVGGGTSLGTSSKLVVQNPSLTPATVTLTVWGPAGRIALPGLDTLLVPAGKQVSVYLEGLSAEQRRVAVNVRSTGALVSAYLQVNTLDGLTPKGTDLVTSGAGPNRVQVMTGVALGDPNEQATESSVVRLVVPDFTEPQDLAALSEERAADLEQVVVGRATITLLGEQGRFVLFGEDTHELRAGTVTDIDLTGVPQGNYSVVVTATTSVLASVRAASVGVEDPEHKIFGIPEDYAWIHSDSVLSAPTEEPAQGESGPTDLESQVDPLVELKSIAGVIPVLPTLTSDLVITALPRAATLSQFEASLAQIPRQYASDIDAQTAQETDAELALREAWRPSQAVQVTTYGDNGRVIGEKQLRLAPGQTLTQKLADLGGDQVRAVSVIGADDVAIDWAVVATAPEISGALGVLRPVTALEQPTEVSVLRSFSVGLD